jgi:hypothetical protein
MAVNTYRMVETSKKYKYVSLFRDHLGNEKWHVSIPYFGINKSFDDEKKAAKFVDMKMIERGKKPVNILVRK